MKKMKLHEICETPTGKIIQEIKETGIDALQVYQRVHVKKGNIKRKGQVGLQLRAHVIPFDPKTNKQMTQRNKLKKAVEDWRALSEVEKNEYRKKEEKEEKTGYQYYVGLNIKGFI